MNHEGPAPTRPDRPLRDPGAGRHKRDPCAALDALIGPRERVTNHVAEAVQVATERHATTPDAVTVARLSALLYHAVIACAPDSAALKRRARELGRELAELPMGVESIRAALRAGTDAMHSRMLDGTASTGDNTGPGIAHEVLEECARAVLDRLLEGHATYRAEEQRRLLVRDIVDGGSGTALPRARALGYLLTPSVDVLLVPSELAAPVARCLPYALLSPPMGPGPHVVVLIPAPEGSAWGDTATALRREGTERGWRHTVLYAGRCDIDSVPHAYAASVAMLPFVRGLVMGDVVAELADWPIHSVAAALSQRSRQALRRTVLCDLETKSTDGVAMLSVFVRFGFRIGKVIRHLGLHKNTVAGRRDDLTVLTGRDLRTFSDQVLMTLAMAARDIDETAPTAVENALFGQ